MKKYILFFSITICYLFSDEIKLYNDSPFELIATVQAATGQVLAQKTLAPDEQSIWNSEQKSTDLEIEYRSTGSYTPYTVIWRCSYQGFYSVCVNVASGAMVAANSCPGAKFCQPKPEEKEKNNTEKSTSCNGCN